MTISENEKALKQHQLCKGITTVCNRLSLTNNLPIVTMKNAFKYSAMKNPCKELENTVWTKDGIEYELILGNTFWKLVSKTDTVQTTLTKNCPKPERIVNWLEQYGYQRK